MRDPEDNLTEPAEFVDNGSNSSSFSESLKATSIGSITPVLDDPEMGSAPKTTKCLSVSLVITCNPTVGTKLAPVIPESKSALTLVPLFSFHR